MTPEERREQRKLKILRRSQMSEHELGNSLSQNKIKDFIKDSSEKHVEVPKEDVVTNY